MTKENKKILITSMGRSGSTWLADLINHKKKFNEVFEPFFPGNVPEAKPFGYYRFLESSNKNTEFPKLASLLMSGKIRNKWLDSGVVESGNKKILVKDIRTNLMLDWIKHNFPQLKIILLIRDPFEVANSWVRLNWKKIPLSDDYDIDVILKQRQLLKSFPEIAGLVGDYKNNTHFESVILEWCILNYVPLIQHTMNPDLCHIVSYNQLLGHPKRELKKVFNFIGEEFDENVLGKINSKSRTTFAGVNQVYHPSEAENNKSLSIIKSFNLEHYIAASKNIHR